MVWNKNHWPLTEEANMIFNKLYDVGILHVNGKEAGKFLNNLGNDIVGWWNDEEVIKAKRIWCNMYARVSKNWLKDLIKIVF